MVHDFTGFERGVIGRKMYSDKTLNNMRKEDLIKLLHIAEHNYETLNWLYGNAVKYNEKNIPIPKWIPCSERLPEEHIGVIVEVDTNIVTQYYMSYVENGKWRMWETDRYLDELEFKPIAWMPIPEPYKESD